MTTKPVHRREIAKHYQRHQDELDAPSLQNVLSFDHNVETERVQVNVDGGGAPVKVVTRARPRGGWADEGQGDVWPRYFVCPSCHKRFSRR